MTENHRVLIIDDNPSIHDDFRKVLQSPNPSEDLLREQEEVLFGEAESRVDGRKFELEGAQQGEEGIEMVASSLEANNPFALAFVDVRMPPGIDGVETVERIFAIDPFIQIVICSAYSDYTALDILQRVGISDRLLLLRKPCDWAEILMLATALCKKWNLLQKGRCIDAPT